MLLHLDTDIAGDIDDLCALAYLLASADVELAGVTTVLERDGARAGYVRHVLALAGRADVPVAAGADVSSGMFRPGEYEHHPEAPYWGGPIAAAPGPVDAALDLLADSIERGALILAIGPFTNLALLERRAPGSLRRAEVVLMGGSIATPPAGFPQWDYRADFNVQSDATGAYDVLTALDPDRATIVPLDVTAQTALRRAELPALRDAGPIGALVARQASALASERAASAERARYPALPADFVNYQHDPLAAAVALGWDGARAEALPLALSRERGWLRMRLDTAARKLRVVTAVDGAAFSAHWLATIVGRGSSA